MSSILLLLILFSSPFIFAGGFNIKAFAAIVHLFGSLFIILFSIKRWNTLISLFLVIILVVLAGMTVSIYFGFFTFGFCLTVILSDSRINPLEDYRIVIIKNSLIVTIITLGSMLLSFCLALIVLIYP